MISTKASCCRPLKHSEMFTTALGLLILTCPNSLSWQEREGGRRDGAVVEVIWILLQGEDAVVQRNRPDARVVLAPSEGLTAAERGVDA